MVSKEELDKYYKDRESFRYKSWCWNCPYEDAYWDLLDANYWDEYDMALDECWNEYTPVEFVDNWNPDSIYYDTDLYDYVLIPYVTGDDGYHYSYRYFWMYDPDDIYENYPRYQEQSDYFTTSQYWYEIMMCRYPYR